MSKKHGNSNGKKNHKKLTKKELKALNHAKLMGMKAVRNQPQLSQTGPEQESIKKAA